MPQPTDELGLLAGSRKSYGDGYSRFSADVLPLNIRDFGGRGNGMSDDARAFTEMIQAHNKKNIGAVYLPAGDWLFNSDPFAGIPQVLPCRIMGAGMQATVLKKGFNGTWMTFGVNFGNFIQWTGLTFDGQHDAGRTGVGFSYTGNAVGAGNDYHSFSRVRFLAIESHFAIGSNAAYALSLLDCEAYPSAAQQSTGEYPFITPTADDTLGNARHRRFTNCLFPLGVIDISGMQDVYMATVGCKRFHTSSTTSQYFIAACLLGNSTAADPISGTGSIVGCRFAGDVVLDASFSGVFVGNYQTAGTFTDNTVAGAATIFHHPLGQIFDVLGQRHKINVNASFQQMIVTSACGNLPDADTTLTVGVNFPVVRFTNALAANRTITLSATGAKSGDRFRIVRTGLGAFTMDVGGLKTIPAATAAFVDVEHDGTAWRLTGYGLL